MLRFYGWRSSHGEHNTEVVGANGFVMLVCLDCELQVSTEDIAAGLPYEIGAGGNPNGTESVPVVVS